MDSNINKSETTIYLQATAKKQRMTKTLTLAATKDEKSDRGDRDKEHGQSADYDADVSAIYSLNRRNVRRGLALNAGPVNDGICHKTRDPTAIDTWSCNRSCIAYTAFRSIIRKSQQSRKTVDASCNGNA
jgi:hypothetical protein